MTSDQHAMCVGARCRLDRVLDGVDAGMEHAMRWLGPPFIAVAALLITMCLAVFLDAVYGEVRHP